MLKYTTGPSLWKNYRMFYVEPMILSTWQDDWNGALANNFILSSQSWEVGSPPTGGAGRLELSCVVHTHLTHSHTLRKDHPSECERCWCLLTVRHILVECNQEWKVIFGRRDVVESFRFHPTLILLVLKQIKFYCKF